MDTTVDRCRRGSRQRRAGAAAGRPPPDVDAVHGPGRQQLQRGGRGQPVDRRRQRSREQLHRRRRQHHQPGLRRDRRLHHVATARWAWGSPRTSSRRPRSRRRASRRSTGEATGGVVNVITRSGSNAFHGSVFGYWRPSGPGGRVEAAANRDRARSTRPARQALDVGVSLGAAAGEGPAVLLRRLQPAVRDPHPRSRPRASRCSSLGEVDQKRRSLSYAGKLTWQATAAHRFDLSAFGDPSHGPPGPQRPLALLFDGRDRVQRARELRRAQPGPALQRDLRQQVAGSRRRRVMRGTSSTERPIDRRAPRHRFHRRPRRLLGRHRHVRGGHCG